MPGNNLKNLTPERRREISAAGGRATPMTSRSFYADPELAQRAGRIGGLRSVEARRAKKLQREAARG